MAGLLTIQRIPRGLLHALGMKGTGDLPKEISPTLFAAFDSTPLYYQDNARSILDVSTAVAAAGVISGGTLSQVPAGEQWLLTNLTIYVSVLAAGNTNWDMTGGYVRRTAYSPILQTFSASMQRFILGQTVWLGWNFHPGDVVLRPGDFLAAGIAAGATATFAANVGVNFFADYYRLEV